MVAFRAARVEADFGFVEYKVVAQHREKWVSGKLCYLFTPVFLVRCN
jgi:hypothetical protein